MSLGFRWVSQKVVEVSDIIKYSVTEIRVCGLESIPFQFIFCTSMFLAFFFSFLRIYEMTRAVLFLGFLFYPIPIIIFRIILDNISCNIVILI